MAKNGREKIVNQAFKLFLHKGYKKTSLADIIDATQLSKGAIYHHFKSKYEIYLATLDEYFFKLYTDISINDDNASFLERIKKRFLFFIDLIDFVEQLNAENTYPIRRYFQFQLESEEDDIIREKITETLKSFQKEIDKIIEQAIQQKEINILLPASVITQQLVGMIEGIAIHHSTLKSQSKVFLLQKYEEVILPYLHLLTKAN
ncbi:TetR/AcrR family transcriptional regulator [Tenacibaculum crassostreae]|uniref:TetR/AcrR family transcriptional regulator n=1 Tax=Tenacibaculum crassostreae TaxID=502683 RepID=UPI00389569D4